MQNEDLIEWNESIHIGIEEIDKQHKILIDIINQLARAMHEKRIESMIIEILQKLIKYTNTHFIFEEIFFENSNYAHRKAHLAEHKTFINRITSYSQDLKTDPDTIISEELLSFLKSWLVNHILVTDKKYVPYFREIKIPLIF